jgi:hypothetical protein
MAIACVASLGPQYGGRCCCWCVGLGLHSPPVSRVVCVSVCVLCAPAWVSRRPPDCAPSSVSCRPSSSSTFSECQLRAQLFGVGVLPCPHPPPDPPHPARMPAAPFFRRIIFDFEKMDRVKVTDSFEFPLVLDMAPFLESGEMDRLRGTAGDSGPAGSPTSIGSPSGT